jgi:membrane protease subunit (stomatin/prohibitin family)
MKKGYTDMTNTQDELRGAIERLLTKWRKDAAQEQSITGAANGAWNNTISCANQLEAAARQAAESPGPDDLVCCARCNEMKECLLIETGFAGEHEPLCASCISAERSLAEVSADELLEEIVKDVFSLAAANCKCLTCLTLDKAVSKIRARKGTFSLRASGTPDYRNELRISS